MTLWACNITAKLLIKVIPKILIVCTHWSSGWQVTLGPFHIPNFFSNSLFKVSFAKYRLYFAEKNSEREFQDKKIWCERGFRIKFIIKYNAPFKLDKYFKILYWNITFKIFLLKVSTFIVEKNFRKPYVNNFVDASFDVSKHWPIDQSQRSMSEITSIKFHKIEHVLNCEIDIFFKIYLFQKLTVHTSNFLAEATNLHKFWNPKFWNKFPK